MLDKITACVAAHLSKFVPDAVEPDEESIFLSLGEDEDQKFDIIVEDFDVHPEDDTNEGTVLVAGRSFVKVIDGDTEHPDLLDACLDAIAQNAELQPLVRDLTTDGDHKDCEAIFDLEGYGYVILKVR